MREKEIDLERAVNDPDYRRKVIEQLKAEAKASEHSGGADVKEAQTASIQEKD